MSWAFLFVQVVCLLEEEVQESIVRSVQIESIEWLNPGDLFPQNFSVQLDNERLEFTAVPEPQDRRVKTWTTDSNGHIVEADANPSDQKAYRLVSWDELYGVATLIANKQNSREKFQLVERRVYKVV